MEETKAETPDQTQNTVGSEAPKRDTLPSMMEGLSGSYEGRSYQELADAVRILSLANTQQARTVERFRRDRERQGYVIKNQNADIAALRSANKQFVKLNQDISDEANKMNDESINHLEMISELAKQTADIKRQRKIKTNTHEHVLPSRLSVVYGVNEGPTCVPDFIVFSPEDLDIPAFFRTRVTPEEHERLKKP